MNQAIKHLLKWSVARRSLCQARADVKWCEVQLERRPAGVTQGARGLAPGDQEGQRVRKAPGSRGSQNAQLLKWMVAPGPTVHLRPQEVCMVAWSATVQSARAALRGWRQAGNHADEERERERECACVR